MTARDAKAVDRMCIRVRDANGNPIARIGRYGNQDDAKGKLAFAQPRSCSVTGRELAVVDPRNGKGTRMGLAYGAEECVAIP